MSSKKVLITGGAGFIGTVVARRLAAKGATPVVFDLRPPRDPTIAYVEGNILDEKGVKAAMADVDAVLHMASLISVEATEKRPRDTLDVAILGTRNVCNAARPDQRVVLASTSEVYGDAPVVPTPETCFPSPKSVYGIAKVACEAYVRTLNAPSGPHFTILRYFSVYGPGQAPSFVVPRFVKQALAGEPITVYGEGNQVRAFGHVEDVAEGTVRATLSPVAAGRTYNLGNPEEPVTMEELARKVVKLTGSSSPIRKVAFADSDRSSVREIYRRIPSIEAASQDLSYRPTKSLEEGIKDVIASSRP